MLRQTRWFTPATAPLIAALCAGVLAGCPADTNPRDGGPDATPSDMGTPPRDVAPTPDGTVNPDTTPPPDGTPPPPDGMVPDAVVPLPDVPTPPPGSVAITQWGVDPARTIANRRETQLTVAAVMGGRFNRDTTFMPPTLDGDVYTQPLYLPGLMAGGSRRDVVFVATQANSVYALDASTGAMVWRTNLGAPVARSSQPCGNISPSTGVLGGMAIDPATNTVYAVAYTSTGGRTFTINALDATTGMQRAGYPQPIVPAMSNGSTWLADPHGERGAIVLVGNRLYVPFGGLFGDCGNYHGWVVGIDTAMPTRQVTWATPGRGSGIWAPGGISSDGTNLFVATGNGFTAASMGEYVVRLAGGATGPTWADMPANFFTPSNRLSLDAADVDLGSIAPVVLPDHAGSSTPRLLLTGGKNGVAYLLNRDNLGGMGTGTGTTGEGLFSARISSGGHFGAGAAWSDGTNVYGFLTVGGTRSMPCSGSGGIVAMRLGTTPTGSNFSVAWCTASGAGAMPAISSNGNSEGILWALYTAGNLRAYAIATGMEILNIPAGISVRKWVPPLVTDGRVFVTGNNTLAMFRLTR